MGFIMAVAFALWIFLWLRGIDVESKDRIAEIVAEQNAELAERIELLPNTLSDVKSRIQNIDVERPEGDAETNGSSDAQR